MAGENYIFANKPLPDIIAYNLKILFIGYNPGLLSAQLGHHYAHKSNGFWRLLYESGLTPNKFDALEDRRLLEFGFGSTNIIDRPSKSASDIKAEELKAGSQKLYELIKELRPAIACYVGIGVYRAYVASLQKLPPSKIIINTGEQKNRLIPDTVDFVCSNPSGLNTIPYHEQLRCFKELQNLLTFCRFS